MRGFCLMIVYFRRNSFNGAFCFGLGFSRYTSYLRPALLKIPSRNIVYSLGPYIFSVIPPIIPNILLLKESQAWLWEFFSHITAVVA
jgi:hypothetical protein